MRAPTNAMGSAIRQSHLRMSYTLLSNCNFTSRFPFLFDFDSDKQSKLDCPATKPSYHQTVQNYFVIRHKG